MTTVQLSERPVQSFLNPFESFKWFSMVHKEISINRRNDSARVFRIKETATKLSVLDVVDWRCFQNGFCIVANKIEGYCMDAICGMLSSEVKGRRNRILPKAFAAAKQAAG